MGQTRKQSFIESVLNIAIGFGINLAANLTVLPLFGLPVQIDQALGIGLVFTVISIARSYCVRRLFNRLHGDQLWKRNKDNPSPSLSGKA